MELLKLRRFSCSSVYMPDKIRSRYAVRPSNESSGCSMFYACQFESKYEPFSVKRELNAFTKIIDSCQPEQSI